MAGAKSSPTMEKNNKYDRQLRLWGDHGQSALEAAKVCLINATATGVEILKNLILPGVGSFTIVDGAKVSGEDIGNNFFLTSGSLDKSRAQATTELLSELNSDVTGDYIEETSDTLLTTEPEFFNNFSVVIATNLTESSLLRLGERLWWSDVPLLVCRCYGFIGYIRLVLNEHTVVESHPDNVFDDLRLDRPFSSLTSFCDSLNLEAMNKKEHSHTPWLVVVYKYLEQWKQSHNGEHPRSYKEKKELKEIIRDGVRRSPEGVPEEEENFDEAVVHLNTSLLPTTVPSEVQKLFEDPKCTRITADTCKFWILTRALKEFVLKEGKGCLPVRGTIPDMTADSDRYIQLQNAYKTQATLDVECFTAHLHAVLEGVGLPLSSKGISEQDIKLFCRNAAFLRVIKGHSLADEYGKSPRFSLQIGQQLESEESDEAVFYVLLRAVDRFVDLYNRLPGWFSDQVETDISTLKCCVVKLLGDWGLGPSIKDDYIHEMCRYGGSELHSVSAYIGGAAAQEAIKIISGQFVPIDNTFVYNAVKQTSVTMRL